MQTELRYGFLMTGILLVLVLLCERTTNAHIARLREDAARSAAGYEESIDSLTASIAALDKKVEDYRATFRTMRMQVNSLRGICDPEAKELVSKWWAASGRTLTLSQTYRLMWIESRCDPMARNGPCVGLMQLDPRSVVPDMDRGEAERWLSDPEANIRAGLIYLDYLRERYRGDKLKILTAWRWGPTRFDNGVTTPEWARKVLAE